MKKILLALMGFLLAANIFAQDKEYRTIFGDRPTSVSGLACFDIQISSLGGDYALGMGGSTGVLINKSVAFGGFGMGTTIDRTVEIDNISYKNINLGYGGLWFGYIFTSNFPIHPAVYVQTGWGAVNLNDSNRSLTDNVFVVNPSVEIELNFTRFFRMALGAHYQNVIGINKYAEMGNTDFSGPGGNISFRFGWF